jgi:hypothetical protein
MHRHRFSALFLLPALLLAGCSRSEARVMSDFLQYLLGQDTWFRWIVCILLVYLVFQTARILRLSLRYLWLALRKSYHFVFVWGKTNFLIISILGTILWLSSDYLLDQLQHIEQKYFSPVYIHQFDQLSEEHLIALYEAELGRQLDPYQTRRVIQRTHEIAARIQSTPLAIYEAAYLECGLYPFTVRSDQVAAGWIQFTRIGLGGLRYKGQPVTFDQVLEACRKEDVEFMMDLTELYLVDKYERAGRQPLLNTIDLYLALFAPALIGAASDQVVYEGYTNPSYYKNDGLDGWYVEKNAAGQDQIFRKRKQCDGKITIWEMFLALEARKNQLVSKKTNK